uniref:Transmembrane protein n=1 Tax=Medicago truncatula TaxID=3880 RepID=I3S5M8_MEDTR|nr:unknown [Medicago truncatula]
MNYPFFVMPKLLLLSSPLAVVCMSMPTTVLEQLLKGTKKHVLLPLTQNLYLKLIPSFTSKNHPN